MSDPERGHQTLPHTADLMVEAWAPSLAACLAEAVLGMTTSFADTSTIAVTRTVPVHLDNTSPDELLLEALEEVIYLADVLGVVPVLANLEETETGGVAGDFEVVPIERVEITGAAPKGVSRSGLDVTHDGRSWRARAIIDL